MSFADYRPTSPMSRRVRLAVFANLVQTIEFVLKGETVRVSWRV